MIVGVPDHQTLEETAVGWMNLAWGIAIDEARKFQDTEFVYDDIAKEHGEEVAQRAIAKHWQAVQLVLNNAVSLLQQSLEINLKAKIAKVSPYLLIAGEPSSWPKVDQQGNVNFSNFRTLDAVQLCRAVNVLSDVPLPDKFVQFYDRLRQTRNKIAHLNASAISVEVKTIIAEILTAQKLLYPDIPWNKFRYDYLIATEEYHDKDAIFTGDDFTTDVMISEVTAALHLLEPKQLREFFGYRESKPVFRCPCCLARRSQSDDECEFVQMTSTKQMVCFVCLSSYAVEEYRERMIEHFGYLGEEEQREIAAELREELP
ncbi:hypothetical protein [Methylobacterium sp. WSM2598]|uniref:hypothetical protein n=1 Tax=Methylobacterium sp. WSM2598 TaxID=398261 RepID=UPI00037E6953|nr:hypothetical protein [Methylobacterium sp. WSM2598]